MSRCDTLGFIRSSARCCRVAGPQHPEYIGLTAHGRLWALAAGLDMARRTRLVPEKK